MTSIPALTSGDEKARGSSVRNGITPRHLLILGFWFFFAPWCLGGGNPASEYHGQVTFGGLPVPGASVTATQGGKHLVTSTDLLGLYSFPDLAEGKCTMEIEMTGFLTIKQNVVIAPNQPAGKWELKLLPLNQIKAEAQTLKTGPAAPGFRPAAANATKSKNSADRASAAPKPAAAGPDANPPKPDATDDARNQQAADGFLINGSMVNGATSPFSQPFAFGNHRNGGRGLYNGGLGVRVDNSALDARPFSLSGQNTPKPEYNRITGLATLGGRIRIPHLLQNGPMFFVGYQWSRNVNDSTQSALVPDAAERGGDFSQALNALGQPVEIFNPATGLPFSGNMIPQAQISSQAQALMNFYPKATFSGDPRYNYQTGIVDSTHQDAMQSRLNHTINSKNQVYGSFAFQSTRSATPNLFGFLDNTNELGSQTSFNWSHRMSPRFFLNLGLRIQPHGNADHALLGESRQCFGRSGHLGE